VGLSRQSSAKHLRAVAATAAGRAKGANRVSTAFTFVEARNVAKLFAENRGPPRPENNSTRIKPKQNMSSA
jgi:hypothetical protein